MAEQKTKPTDESVTEFLNGITDEKKRRDCFKILQLMRDVTGEEARMWGNSMVGFGRYSYEYASGRKGESFLTGFSPRKQNLSLYIMSGFDRYDELMKRLGKYTTGKSCLYIKRLEDIDQPTLQELVKESVAYMIKIHS